MTNIVNLVYLCSIKSEDMKTQLLNTDQALSGINLLKNMIPVKFIAANIAGFKLPSTYKLLIEKAGQYVLPLAKQLFRGNFMGSDMEMGILLLFIKSYFMVAVYMISHNSISRQFRKVQDNISKNILAPRDTFYQHKQAA